MHAAAARASFTVSQGVSGRIEIIEGARHAWRFRPHFHAGDEIVQVLAGRARLRLPSTCREVVAGGALGAQAMALLTGRPSLHTDVEAIAQACAVSAGHLARAFRRETGTSLHNFHVLLALHKAKASLRNQAPVIDAALDAGFYDQVHLNREFVKTFGMTPAVFRAGWAAA